MAGDNKQEQSGTVSELLHEPTDGNGATTRTVISVVESNKWAEHKWGQVVQQVEKDDDISEIRKALQDIVTYAKLGFVEKLITKQWGLIRLSDIPFKGTETREKPKQKENTKPE